jgi:putative oxidoreductase
MGEVTAGQPNHTRLFPREDALQESSTHDPSTDSEDRRGFPQRMAGSGAGMTFFQRFLATNAPAAVILIRLVVGLVFLEAGIQKFPEGRGAAAFTKIGIPAPEFTAPFVAVFEITCGTLVLLGLFTRFAAIPLMVVMLMAISTTKFPILLHDGFWKMAHEVRLDYAMLLGAIFLLLVGAGPWSLDARISRKASNG